MEDLCWTDVLLSADVETPDGGRSNGLGSMWEYALHCNDASHKKGRDARLVKQVGSPGRANAHSPQGLSVPAPDSLSTSSPSTSSLPLDTHPATSSLPSSSFPDRSSQQSHTSLHSQTPFRAPYAHSMSSSPAMKPEPLQGESRRVNMSSPAVRSTAGKGKGKAKAYGGNIISLLDSDDDDGIVFAGRSTPKVKPATPKWELVWNKMTVAERVNAVKRERQCLRRAFDNCKDADLRRLIAARREQMRALSVQINFKVWSPPKPELFRAIPYHKYDMAEKLAATFEPPQQQASFNMPGSFAAGGVDSKPIVPPYAPYPGSSLYPSTSDPLSAGPSSHGVTDKAAAAYQAMAKSLGGLSDTVKSFASGSGNILSQHLPAGGIGTVINGLQGLPDKYGLPGLPALPGGLPGFSHPAQDFAEEFGFEFNRPTE